MDIGNPNSGSVSGWFWGIVQQADKDPERLEAILRDLPSEQIRQFALEFHEVSSALWCEPYIDYLTHKSEDSIADFSYWVVSQGRQFYEKIRGSPEIAAGYEDIARMDRTTIAFVADSILDDRYGDDWNLHDDYASFSASGYQRMSDYLKAEQASKQ